MDVATYTSYLYSKLSVEQIASVATAYDGLGSAVDQMTLIYAACLSLPSLFDLATRAHTIGRAKLFLNALVYALPKLSMIGCTRAGLLSHLDTTARILPTTSPSKRSLYNLPL